LEHLLSFSAGFGCCKPAILRLAVSEMRTLMSGIPWRAAKKLIVQ
jgi:hypothetical protein